MIENLLTCDACEHGIALHGNNGCDVFRCRCDHSKDGILERTIERETHEYRRTWHEDSKRAHVYRESVD